MTGESPGETPGSGPVTVRGLMVSVASTHPPTLTVEQARAVLANPKLHLVLITEHGRLLGTLVESDLGEWAAGMALTWASLGPDRLVGPEADPELIRAQMIRAGQRRRAVVDADGHLLGLLCLKRHQRGFCSDADVAARRAEREALGDAQGSTPSRSASSQVSTSGASTLTSASSMPSTRRRMLQPLGSLSSLVTRSPRE
jgi:hypothetical protein